jgi:hypothetical protein
VRAGGLPDWKSWRARGSSKPGSCHRWANGCCRASGWNPAGLRAPRAYRPILAVEPAERIN